MEDNKNDSLQWVEIQRKLFPIPFPKREVWDNLTDILEVLKEICSDDNSNHLFYPGRGGDDLKDVELAAESGCISLDCGFISIVKPKRLLFESFDNTPEWNYFRLETNELSRVLERDVEHPGVSSDEVLSELLTELSPGQYLSPDILENKEVMSINIPLTIFHGM